MKPVGTVHIATARTNQRIVHEEHFFEEETREGVLLAAVQAALQMLRDRMA
jgi:nicotinamide-nucleotide amidase